LEEDFTKLQTVEITESRQTTVLGIDRKVYTVDKDLTARVALPVLLISGRVTRSLRDRASGLGIRDVLEKPLSDLAGSIRRVLDDGP
jgi:hypothetical protein